MTHLPVIAAWGAGVDSTGMIQRLYGGPAAWLVVRLWRALSRPGTGRLWLYHGWRRPGPYPANALQVQQHLDSEWNLGDHARPLSSVLSATRYEAHVYDGWPSVAFPAEPPRYK